MLRKLTLMRRKHAQTRDYMVMNAHCGGVKDGAGITLYNHFTEFGLAQISVDFALLPICGPPGAGVSRL